MIKIQKTKPTLFSRSSWPPRPATSSSRRSSPPSLPLRFQSLPGGRIWSGMCWRWRSCSRWRCSSDRHSAPSGWPGPGVRPRRCLQRTVAIAESFLPYAFFGNLLGFFSIIRIYFNFSCSFFAISQVF